MLGMKKKVELDVADMLQEVIKDSNSIQKSMIHGIELMNTLESKMFYFWISYFKSRFIHDIQVNLYYVYSKDDPEKREPAPYDENVIDSSVEAITDIYDIDRQVNICFNLSKVYEIKDTTDLFYYIGLLAFHETMHVLLVDFASYGHDKNKMIIRGEVDKVKDEHKFIMNLENNMYPIIFENVYNKLIKYF